MPDIGKRYHCDTCGTEVLIIKAGSGEELSCCQVLMTTAESKPLPSAD